MFSCIVLYPTLIHVCADCYQNTQASSYHSCSQLTPLAKNPRAHPLQSLVHNLQLPAILPAHVHVPSRTLHNPATRSSRSSSCLTLSRPPVPSHVMFSNHAISITAPRLWNYLPSELRTISLPPPLLLPIPRHYIHPAPLSTTPGLPLKTKMSSLQNLLR